MNRVLHIKQQKCVTRMRCKHREVAPDAVQAKSWEHPGLLQFEYVVHCQPSRKCDRMMPTECQTKCRMFPEAGSRVGER